MRALRVVAGVLAALVGLLALAGGAAVAFWLVGPDDVLGGSSKQLTSKGVAIATTQETLGYKGVDLQVTVTSGKSGIPVFIGLAHDKQIKSYFDGQSYTKISSFDIWRMSYTTEDVAGKANKVSLPDGRDWWDKKAIGKGAVTMTVPLTDQTGDLVIMRGDGKGDVAVTATFGMGMPGAFRTSLIAAGAGLALLVLGLLALRGSKTRKHDVEDDEPLWEGKDAWDRSEFWNQQPGAPVGVGDPMAGAPGMPGPMQGGPMQGGPMQGGPMQGGPMQGGPGGPMQGGPMQGGPMQGGPMQGGPGGPPQGSGPGGYVGGGFAGDQGGFGGPGQDGPGQGGPQPGVSPYQQPGQFGQLQPGEPQSGPFGQLQPGEPQIGPFGPPQPGQPQPGQPHPGQFGPPGGQVPNPYAPRDPYAPPAAQEPRSGFGQPAGFEQRSEFEGPSEEGDQWVSGRSQGGGSHRAPSEADPAPTDLPGWSSELPWVSNPRGDQREEQFSVQPENTPEPGRPEDFHTPQPPRPQQGPPVAPPSVDPAAPPPFFGSPAPSADPAKPTFFDAEPTPPAADPAAPPSFFDAGPALPWRPAASRGPSGPSAPPPPPSREPIRDADPSRDAEPPQDSDSTRNPDAGPIRDADRHHLDPEDDFSGAFDERPDWLPPVVPDSKGREDRG